MTTTLKLDWDQDTIKDVQDALQVGLNALRHELAVSQHLCEIAHPTTQMALDKIVRLGRAIEDIRLYRLAVDKAKKEADGADLH